MKCKACNGKGKIKAIDFTKPDWKDTEKVCPICYGSGVVKQTNEEWINGLSTIEKAKVIVDLGRKQRFPKDVEVEFCEQWLKEEHRESE